MMNSRSKENTFLGSPMSLRRGRQRRVVGLALIMLLAVIEIILLSGCSSLKQMNEPVGAVGFEQYREQTLKHQRERRDFQLTDKEMELRWNSPQEWKPSSSGGTKKPSKGILLVHGLGDSPWSFFDIAQELTKQGFLVRTVLLPGHGTRPEDLLTVTAEEWQKVVHEQAGALINDVQGDVYLGGFSTGANFVLDYAYRHEEIAGLVLFSPGFKSLAFDWLAPLVSKVRPWIITPGGEHPSQTPVRYMNIPTNAYAQFYRSSVMARDLLKQPYDKPVFMAVAQHDSVLDTDYLLNIFQERFTNPQSRLIWYGGKSEGMTDLKRIIIRGDKLPEQHISQFSHMGLMFSPDNKLYGKDGSLRICLNSLDSEEREACENGADLWFSGWGYKEEGKVHARLTFNPYFSWQTTVMVKVLGSSGGMTTPTEKDTFTSSVEFIDNK